MGELDSTRIDLGETGLSGEEVDERHRGKFGNIAHRPQKKIQCLQQCKGNIAAICSEP